MPASRKAWIDLTNSPHVMFFRPILRRLDDAGVPAVVTARDFAQTLGLLDLYGIPHTVVGRHAGGALTSKGVAFVRRGLSLARFGRAQKGLRQAVSHGSTDLSLAAGLLGLHNTVLQDYEGAAIVHRINFRLADKVIMPGVIPTTELQRLGLDLARFRPYAGIKEQISLADFQPDPSVIDALGLDRDRLIAVLRPPATMSLYHRFENPLFDAVLASLIDRDVQVVLLPRTPEQRQRYASVRGVTMPQVAVDGPSLLQAADLVVSAGGTMNREAALLGTPTWTIFAGAMGAVDRMLVESGRMRRLERVEDLELRKRPSEHPSYDALADDITAEILRM